MNAGGPLSARETRALLEELHHHPRKRFGQNFLIDGNIVRKSLEIAQVREGDLVVEVGPGLGTLTRALLGTGAHVWAVEIDSTLCAHLERNVAPLASDRFHLCMADAVRHPRGDLPDRVAASGFKIVANLPYAITTPWIEKILTHPLPERMVLMVQKEAADRFFANPESKSFSGISVLLQSAFHRRAGHSVARTCFYPAPEVDSVLLHLERRSNPFLFSEEHVQRIRACFTKRRKQIGGIARGDDVLIDWLRRCEDLGVTPETRPEEIPIAAWQRL